MAKNSKNTISIKVNRGDDNAVSRNIENYSNLTAWARWYPDLFLDLIKPKNGGINLGADQRIFLRASIRFLSMYGVFPRGWSKTFLEVLAMYIACIWFPKIEFALTAQTKENSASLLKDKFTDITNKYPWFLNEISSYRFSKNDAEIKFKNGSYINNLSNSNASKGQRRHQIMVEESALVDNETLQDALIPIAEHGRLTCGKLGIANPEEVSQKLNYYTTAGFRGSDEFNHSINMLNEMSDCEGKIVLGSDWHLGCWYGRGSSKKQILDKKKNMPPTAFAQNYESKWVGSVDGALIAISKLLKIRELTKPELCCPRDKNGNLELCEYVIGVDIARSNKESNNKTAIVIIKIIRSKDGDIISKNIVNIIEPKNGLNFEEQAIFIKKVFYNYGGNLDIIQSRVKAIVVDINGVGQGCYEELLKTHVDVETGKKLGAFASINTDDKSQEENAPQLLYGIKAQGINGDMIRCFIDAIESDKLKLLKNYNEIRENLNKDELENVNYEVACVQTQLLIDEVANLKLKTTQTSQTVEQVVKRIDKDRYSATIMALYYIYLFLEKQSEESSDYDFVFTYS